MNHFFKSQLSTRNDTGPTSLGKCNFSAMLRIDETFFFYFEFVGDHYDSFPASPYD